VKNLGVQLANPEHDPEMHAPGDERRVKTGFSLANKRRFARSRANSKLERDGGSS
jgi:hypothetical protein